MMRKRLGTATLKLVASVAISMAFSQAQITAQQNVPAEYQAGIAQLRIAKGYLEAAGDRWGGYRARGIASIDQAFKALGVSTESTPRKPQSGNVNVDEPGMMNSGISALQAARAEGAGVVSPMARVDDDAIDLEPERANHGIGHVPRRRNAFGHGNTGGAGFSGRDVVHSARRSDWPGDPGRGRLRVH